MGAGTRLAATRLLGRRYLPGAQRSAGCGALVEVLLLLPGRLDECFAGRIANQLADRRKLILVGTVA